MRHTEETIATSIPEPPDGSIVAVADGDGYLKVIQREDRAAEEDSAERWFDSDPTSDGMTFYQQVRNAEAIYVLGEPTVKFYANDEVA